MLKLSICRPCWYRIDESGLAAHTRNLQARTNISLLVMQPEMLGESVHALPRVTLAAIARVLTPASRDWGECRASYLARFPEAEPMTQLGDFMFVAVEVKSARHVAGFGAARSVDDGEVRRALGGKRYQPDFEGSATESE